MVKAALNDTEQTIVFRLTEAEAMELGVAIGWLIDHDRNPNPVEKERRQRLLVRLLRAYAEAPEAVV